MSALQKKKTYHLFFSEVLCFFFSKSYDFLSDFINYFLFFTCLKKFYL
ncbi:hypothetical protein HMPREF0080_00215 [Anaeroglobus geminatus F0357]|uniref:Uncharacterized protein n=1 Tax=Anaeroglobus geminatus F0357 TaxID=861450 RepID=G9YF06_9FIRM|nr:hypothetical protein HMPREF0080_00215 [Anaeroglobus geminatus F0357]